MYILSNQNIKNIYGNDCIVCSILKILIKIPINIPINKHKNIILNRNL